MTCSRGEDTLDICAECGRVREGDADDALRCRYEDCLEGHPLTEGDEPPTCPTCRVFVASGLRPYTQGEP